MPGNQSSGERPEVSGADQGGDPVCWLDRVCVECGGFISDDGTCFCESVDG